MKNTLVLTILFLMTLSLKTGWSQPIITVPNPSFERTFNPPATPISVTSTGYGYWQWHKCNSSPDIMAGDGQWGVNKAPQHLDYYAMMIMPSNAQQYIESISADLSTPLIPCQTYEFTVQLANMKKSTSVCPDNGNSYVNNFWEIELELYGTNSCGEDELLWQSGHITNCDWEEYTATFTPCAAYTQIQWRPKWVDVYALGLPATWNRQYAVGVDNMSSIVPLIAPVPEDTVYVQLCNGDSVFAGGAYQTLPGIYNDTLQTICGCESIISTIVNVSSAYIQNTSIDICAGDSALIGGVYQTIAGIYSDTLESVGSCDSIINTTLNVSPAYIQNTSIDICNGDSVLIGGVYQTIAGIYNDTLQSVSSCDSIISTTLNVLPAYFYNISVDICVGDSVLVGGVYQTVAGTYNNTVQLSSSCDSVTITTVNVLSAFIYNTSVDICNGDSLFVGGGYQTVSGIYNDTIQSVSSCDSIISTALNVLPAYLYNTSVDICYGDNLFVGGGYQTVSGIYNDTIQSVNSCDSIISTTLNVLPSYIQNTSIDICHGDSVLIGSVYQTLAGTYNDTIQSVSSCDSIISTTLNILPAYFYNAALDICHGDSVLIGGVYQTLAGTYNDTIQSVGSCDSVVGITLNILPTYFYNITLNICDGDSVLIGGVYETTAGIYNDTYQTINGCDSIVINTVEIGSGGSATINEVFPICQGIAPTSLSAINPGGVWSGQGIVNPIIGVFDPSTVGVGLWTITYTIAGSCGDSQNATIEVMPETNLRIEVVSEHCPDDSDFYLTARPAGGNWTGLGVDEDTGLFSIEDAGPGTHTIYYDMYDQCADRATIDVVILESCPESTELIYYVPNAFTPDGDEHNQMFQPIFTSGHDPFDFHMIIFNRWGEVVFESYDADVGWDGTYANHLAMDGIYVWKIEFKHLNVDKRTVLTGHVNLLR
jgi:gliding motility-associated-like protein